MSNNELGALSQSLSKMALSQVYLSSSGLYVDKYEVQHSLYGSVTKYVYYAAEYGRRIYEFSREYIVKVHDRTLTVRFDREVEKEKSCIVITDDQTIITTHLDRPVPMTEVNWNLKKHNNGTYKFADTYWYTRDIKNKDVFEELLEFVVAQDDNIAKQLDAAGIDFSATNPFRLYNEAIAEASRSDSHLQNAKPEASFAKNTPTRTEYFQAQVYEGGIIEENHDSVVRFNQKVVGTLNVNKDYSGSNAIINYDIKSVDGSSIASGSLGVTGTSHAAGFMKPFDSLYYRGVLKITPEMFSASDSPNVLSAKIQNVKFTAIDLSGLFAGQKVQLKYSDIKYVVAYAIEDYLDVEDADGNFEYVPFNVIKRDFFGLGNLESDKDHEKTRGNYEGNYHDKADIDKDSKDKLIGNNIAQNNQGTIPLNNNAQLTSVQYTKYEEQNVHTEEIFYDQNHDITKITSTIDGVTQEVKESSLESLYEEQFAAEVAINRVNHLEAHWAAEVFEDLGNGRMGAKVADIRIDLEPPAFIKQTLAALNGKVHVTKADGRQYSLDISDMPHAFSTNSIAVDGSVGNDHYPEPALKLSDMISAPEHYLFD